MEKANFKVKNIVYIALFAALLSVLAPVAIPIGEVPITLATLVIYITASVLPVSNSYISIAIYILVGIFGLPVFSGFSGGLAKVAGPTGGYIIGYIPMAVTIGLIIKFLGHKKFSFFIAYLTGTVVLYTFGTALFMIQTQKALLPSLSMCVIPFLPGDAAKMVIAAIISRKLNTLIYKN